MKTTQFLSYVVLGHVLLLDVALLAAPLAGQAERSPELPRPRKQHGPPKKGWWKGKPRDEEIRATAFPRLSAMADVAAAVAPPVTKTLKRGFWKKHGSEELTPEQIAVRKEFARRERRIEREQMQQMNAEEASRQPAFA